MNPQTSSIEGTERQFWLRFSVLIAGYALAISGPLLIFMVPMYVPFLCIIAGSCLVMSMFRRGPRLTKRLLAILIVGWIVIIGTLYWIGDARTREWQPQPTGFTSAWVGLLYAVHHVQWLLSRHFSRTGNGS